MIIYTKSELEAHNLLVSSGRIACTTSNQSVDVHEAANRIIELAERIKAERSVVAMTAK